VTGGRDLALGHDSLCHASTPRIRAIIGCYADAGNGRRLSACRLRLSRHRHVHRGWQRAFAVVGVFSWLTEFLAHDALCPGVDGQSSEGGIADQWRQNDQRAGRSPQPHSRTSGERWVGRLVIMLVRYEPARDSASMRPVSSARQQDAVAGYRCDRLDEGDAVIFLPRAAFSRPACQPLCAGPFRLARLLGGCCSACDIRASPWLILAVGARRQTRVKQSGGGCRASLQRSVSPFLILESQNRPVRKAADDSPLTRGRVIMVRVSRPRTWRTVPLYCAGLGSGGPWGDALRRVAHA